MAGLRGCVNRNALSVCRACSEHPLSSVDHRINYAGESPTQHTPTTDLARAITVPLLLLPSSCCRAGQLSAALTPSARSSQVIKK